MPLTGPSVEAAGRRPASIQLRIGCEQYHLAENAIQLAVNTLEGSGEDVLLAEALYRAWSVTTGHPYHRE